MKTHLAVFLCLSVLLSGCMTANSAISNPRPGSAAEDLLNMWGLVGDIGISVGLAALIVFPTGLWDKWKREDESKSVVGWEDGWSTAMQNTALLGAASLFGVIIADAVCLATTEPEEEPSE